MQTCINLHLLGTWHSLGVSFAGFFFFLGVCGLLLLFFVLPFLVVVPSCHQWNAGPLGHYTHMKLTTVPASPA